MKTRETQTTRLSIPMNHVYYHSRPVYGLWPRGGGVPLALCRHKWHQAVCCGDNLIIKWPGRFLNSSLSTNVQYLSVRKTNRQKKQKKQTGNRFLHLSLKKKPKKNQKKPKKKTKKKQKKNKKTMIMRYYIVCPKA